MSEIRQSLDAPGTGVSISRAAGIAVLLTTIASESLGCTSAPGSNAENCFDTVVVSVTDRNGRTGAYEGELTTPEGTIGFSCPPRVPSIDPDREAWCLPDGSARIPVGPRYGYSTRPKEVAVSVRQRSAAAGPVATISQGVVPVAFAISAAGRGQCQEASARIAWSGTFPLVPSAADPDAGIPEVGSPEPNCDGSVVLVEDGGAFRCN